MRKKLTLLVLLFILPLSSQAATVFSLHAPTIEKNSSMPTAYTCDGKDISPALNWTDAPTATKTFALILSDPDASSAPNGIFYHWILYNLPGKTFSLPEAIAFLPKGTEAGANSWGKTVYKGPCPPQNTTHHYIFTLYALDAELQPKTAMNADTLLRVLSPHLLAKTELKTIYGH